MCTGIAQGDSRALGLGPSVGQGHAHGTATTAIKGDERALCHSLIIPGIGDERYRAIGDDPLDAAGRRTQSHTRWQRSSRIFSQLHRVGLVGLIILIIDAQHDFDLLHQVTASGTRREGQSPRIAHDVDYRRRVTVTEHTLGAIAHHHILRRRTRQGHGEDGNAALGHRPWGAFDGQGEILRISRLRHTQQSEQRHRTKPRPGREARPQKMNQRWIGF